MDQSRDATLTMLFQQHKPGWLGIDIGTASVKIAQAARTAEGVTCAARILVPRVASLVSSETQDEVDETAREVAWSVQGEIRAGLSMQDGFRGRSAAVALPMADCELYQVSLPMLEPEDFDLHVSRALRSISRTSVENLQFDFWPSEFEPRRGKDHQWNVMGVARRRSDRAYRDLLENRLSCKLIDGAPHALARAATYTRVGNADDSFACLDWGISRATFVLIHHGNPVYVRILKDCGFQRMLNELAETIGVESAEAHHLLMQFGIGRSGSDARAKEETALIREGVNNALLRLQQEFDRTMRYLQCLRRPHVPQELILFGAGALVRGLPHHLAARLGLKTGVWSLDSSRARLPGGPASLDCLFGTAFGLSLLAWEDLKCAA